MTTHPTPRTTSAIRRWKSITLLGVLPILALSACAGGDDEPASLTPQEICALVATTEMADLVGAGDVNAEAGPSSAQSACVYSYTRPVGLPGTANIFVSVLTGDRTDNKTGSEALAHIAAEAGAVEADALDGVDAENFTTSAGPGQMVAALDAHGRVATLLLDSDLTADQQAGVTNAVLEALSKHG